MANGSYVSATATNAASNIPVITLDVQKGDVIDFTSHANPDFTASHKDELGLNQFGQSEYAKGRYAFFDCEFRIDYIVKNSSYSSRFAPDESSTFPVFESYNATLMKLGDYVDVTYPGAWQMGFKTVAGDRQNFTAYERLYKATNSGQMILSYDGAYWSDRGGVYMAGEPYLMFSGMSYSADYTSVTAHVADPTIRYTAEYTGTATVRLNKLFFCANDAAYLDILHNGEPIIDPYGANGGTNRGADLGVLVVELAEGDTLDFVSRANDDYAGANLAELGLSKFDANVYGFCAKRGVYDFDIEVTYLSAKDGDLTVSENGQAQATANTPLPLFVWYNSADKLLSDGSARETFSVSAGNGFMDEDGFHFFPGLTD